MSLFSNKKFVLGIAVYTVLVLASGYLVGKSGFGNCERGRDHGTRMHHGKMTDHVASTLSLNETQKTQLEDIVSRHKSSIKEVRGEFREKYDGLRDKKVTEINAILSTEQQAKFSEMRSKWTGKKAYKKSCKGKSCDSRKGEMKEGKACCKKK